VILKYVCFCIISCLLCALILLCAFITGISSVLANTQAFTLKINFDLRDFAVRDGINGLN
jgi:hypothetical protein